MKKNTIPFLLLATLSIGLSSCGTSKKPTVEHYEKKEAPVYVSERTEEGNPSFVPDPNGTKITYHFFNNSLIPYLELTDFITNYVSSSEVKSYVTFTKENDGFKLKINNPNVETYLFLNTNQQKLIYHNMTNYMLSGPEDKYAYESFFGAGKYLFKDGNYTFEEINKGDTEYTIDLTKYNMKLFEYNDKCYASNYLVYNAIWPLMLGSFTPYFYNGTNAYSYAAYLADQDGLDALKLIRTTGDLYSKTEYLQYNYDLLALIYDNFFGLDKRTSIFDGTEHVYFKDGAYIALEPFKSRLLSSDPNATNNAMIEFYNAEVNDGGHSSYTVSDILTDSTNHSAFTGDYLKIAQWGHALSVERLNKMLSPKYVNINFDGYYKEYKASDNSDVAFITFDSFNNTRKDGQKLTKDSLVEEEYGKATASLFGYANKQIRDHNIKDVVIDISCNGGGSGDAVMFIMSWLTGKGGTMTLKNPKDGTIIRVTGYADVNFDGTYNEEDVIPSDVNVYAIVSPETFSSANLLSVLLKEHTNTKFIGTRSGGGSCNASGFYGPLCIQPRMSGLAQLGLNSSTKDNFVSDEAGVIADFYKLSDDIANVSQFYDRDTIISKIKQK